MTIKQSKVQHVVAVPYPAQGHINPMLQLCQQLVPHGLTFTFVNTHHIHQRAQSSAISTDNTLLDSHTHVRHQDAYVQDPNHANGSRLNNVYTDAIGVSPQDNGGHRMQIQSHRGPKECNPICTVFVEGGCVPENHAHISTSRDTLVAAQDMKEHVEQLISNIMEEQPVAFILTDIFCGWGNATAKKFGLPWVCFCPASAATCAIFMHLADQSEQGKLIPVGGKQDGEAVPELEDIPGLPPMRLDEIPKIWDDTGKISHEVVKYFARVQGQASFLLLNTFSELEGQALQALSMRSCPTLAIGPLLPSRFIHLEDCPDKSTKQHEQLGGNTAAPLRPSLFREDRTCLGWLDKQAPSSVLFISFGSISARTEEQLEELAHGVVASGCPFLWVRRPDIVAEVDSSRQPPAAPQLQHIGHAGLVVPWAPQLEVLSHPAIGGFITHCGWNSVMESVAMGVPMLCWADTGERMSSQKLVVQVWKCGLNMVEDSSRRFKQHADEATQVIGREEIAQSIRWLMKEERGAPVRARAAHLRDLAISAFSQSSSQLDHLAQAMVQPSHEPLRCSPDSDGA